MCCCKLLGKVYRQVRGPRGACGKLEHGKRVDGSSARVCFACGRPKGDTTAAPSRPSRHIGDGTIGRIGRGWLIRRIVYRVAGHMVGVSIQEEVLNSLL